MTPAQRRKRHVGSLPASLEEALVELKKDKFVCDTLGEHVLTKFVEAKQMEWNEYKTRVSQWEIDRYLSKY